MQGAHFLIWNIFSSFRTKMTTDLQKLMLQIPQLKISTNPKGHDVFQITDLKPNILQ